MVKKPGGRPLAHRCEAKYSLQVKIFYFDPSSTMCGGGTLQSAEDHPCTLVVECHPATSFLLRNFTPVVCKVSPGFFTRFGRPMGRNYELVFLTGVRPNGAFDRRATKTWVRPFEVRPWGQIFIIFTWRDFGPLRQWSRKFPSTIYYPFWPPHGRKFRFGLFDQGATRGGSNFQSFPLERVFRTGTRRQWSRKFPSRIFYSFWPPYRQKFWFGLFDQSATKWVKFPKFTNFWPWGAQNG